MNNKKNAKEAKPDAKKSTDNVYSPKEAFPAEVVEILGRTGARGEVTQIRCKVLTGRDQNKVMRRNVKGPTRKGDIIMMKETEIEAAPLTGRRKKR